MDVGEAGSHISMKIISSYRRGVQLTAIKLPPHRLARPWRIKYEADGKALRGVG